jgi:hypothetical protein
VNVLPGSSGMCVSCNDAFRVVSIKTEQCTDVEVKVEEIPEPTSFTEIKVEPDEVSYVSLCHQYTKMAGLFIGLCYLGLPT